MLKTTSLRHRLFLILNFKSQQDKRAAWVFSWVITALVLLNVLGVVLESVPHLNHQYSQAFALFEIFSVFFFSLEYLLRLWTAVENKPLRRPPLNSPRWGYVLSFHGLIDLQAVLPFFLPSLVPGLDLRFLRIVRVLRILKLSHYSTALEDLIASIYAEMSAFVSALYLLALTIMVSSCLMYFAEHRLQPAQFGTIPDAIWWSIITITTVGYGDAAPISILGKCIGALTALSGVFTVALLTGIVASAFSTRMRRQEIVFTAEVEELAKDGHLSGQEIRTIQHLRREFNISQDHAQAIVRQILEEKAKAAKLTT